MVSDPAGTSQRSSFSWMYSFPYSLRHMTMSVRVSWGSECNLLINLGALCRWLETQLQSTRRSLPERSSGWSELRTIICILRRSTSLKYSSWRHSSNLFVPCCLRCISDILRQICCLQKDICEGEVLTLLGIHVFWYPLSFWSWIVSLWWRASLSRLLWLHYTKPISVRRKIGGSSLFFCILTKERTTRLCSKIQNLVKRTLDEVWRSAKSHSRSLWKLYQIRHT